jgi:hypothetical protein
MLEEVIKYKSKKEIYSNYRKELKKHHLKEIKEKAKETITYYRKDLII